VGDTRAVDWPAILAASEVQALVDMAISEDLGSGDITSRSIFNQPEQVHGRIFTRGPTVLCGGPLAEAVFRRFDSRLRLEPKAHEGLHLECGQALFELHAEVRAVLAAERTVLNFLQRLCGIAAQARAAVDLIPNGCRAKIYDTRKTTPGWRRLEKAAVRTGGAENHRFGLYDAILIKDNHVVAAGSVRRAVELARSANQRDMKVEVEIDRLDQLEEAIVAGADIVLLDNMAPPAMRRAVDLARGRVELEASGGITLERIPEVAATGVDRISMGSLTHTVRPADLSLELFPSDGTIVVR
jgi:nicotinate-nucleotide pyrophosphorylase (carboxylating)